MDKPNKISLGSRISKWENNFAERHPVFHPIAMEFIAELLIAAVLAVFAFNILPPDLSFKVSQEAPQASVLSITNNGLIYARGEYEITSKSPIKKDPVVTNGEEYVDSVERKSSDTFDVRLSGLPYKKKIKVEFKSDNIMVKEV